MKRHQPERRERLAFMRWIHYHPEIHKYLFAIENGGSRHSLEAVNLKKSGLRPGVPDYLFMRPSGKFHGLWIEFKANKNKLTSYQKDFFKLAESVNYKCVVVWSWEDAVIEIKHYLTKC